MATAMTIEEHEARIEECRDRIVEIHNEATGRDFSPEEKGEYNELNQEIEGREKTLVELKAREQRISELTDRDKHREDGAVFHTSSPGATRGGDIWDLTSVRASVNSPQEAKGELHERAQRALEVAAFPHERAEKSRVQEHVQRLLDQSDNETGELARHILQTGSPTYRRAFGKLLSQKPLTGEEQRALAVVGTTTTGGFAVPYTLDPTVIPTSSGEVNPYRQIARVENLVGSNEWRGVTSAGITASYDGEAEEVSDDSPTLGQPTVTVQKAQAFVPFSIEAGQDWPSLEANLARMVQDSKDDLEAARFSTGAGTGTSPQGIAVGATTTFDTAGSGAFAIGDVYALEGELPNRFRSRAVWLADRGVYSRTRQFDNNGGSDMWFSNLVAGLGDTGPRDGRLAQSLLGYPTYEASGLSSTVSAGELIAVFGDFRHFLIVDRIGLTVEIIQHLLGTANNRPTGQRGFYAYWRNSSRVLVPNAFRVLKVKA